MFWSIVNSKRTYVLWSWLLQLYVACFEMLFVVHLKAPLFYNPSWKTFWSCISPELLTVSLWYQELLYANV